VSNDFFILRRSSMSHQDLKQGQPAAGAYPNERRQQERQPQVLDAEQSARLRTLLVRGIAGATAATVRAGRSG
jgi:hypothetical protein